MSAALYNDNDANAAAWLRELIAEGLLPAGEVSTVSIKEIAADDCADTSHFFAGIGGWPLALEIAGWPAERPVWTGSCPCQPFSAAGKRSGTDDPRHLWPDFLCLIRERRPPIIFGEQVASADGRAWLAGVRADLEALGYAVGAADLCSAGIGAPHIRQRLYWGAKRLGDSERFGQSTINEVGGKPNKERAPKIARSAGRRAGGMADADLQGSGGRGVFGPGEEGHSASNGAARERSAGLREAERMADASGAGLEGRAECQNVPINALLGRAVWEAKTGEYAILANAGGWPTAAIIDGAACRLNPKFSLWLMGYPAEWAYCGERAMQSTRT